MEYIDIDLTPIDFEISTRRTSDNLIILRNQQSLRYLNPYSILFSTNCQKIYKMDHNGQVQKFEKYVCKKKNSN